MLFLYKGQISFPFCFLVLFEIILATHRKTTFKCKC